MAKNFNKIHSWSTYPSAFFEPSSHLIKKEEFECECREYEYNPEDCPCLALMYKDRRYVYHPTIGHIHTIIKG